MKRYCPFLVARSDIGNSKSESDDEENQKGSYTSATVERFMECMGDSCMAFDSDMCMRIYSPRIHIQGALLLGDESEQNSEA